MKNDTLKKLDELDVLVRDTNKANPNPSDVAALRKVLDDEPELVRIVGNIGNQIFTKLLDGATNQSALYRECARKYIEKMKVDLGYHQSTFVERMLIDEVILRWLRLQMIENDHVETTHQSHTFEQGMYIEKRLHLTQKRYLNAFETLAKVRKLIAQTQAKGVEMFNKLKTKDA